MAFTQQKFLNSSIRGFNTNIGWGQDVSTCSISLVDDLSNTPPDSFSPVNIGTPLSFQYDTWIFNGILQSFKRIRGREGNPVYSVVLVDPREVLSGTQLILRGYNGSVFGVSNLLNIYGFLENTQGFGGSEINDAGIPWGKVRDSIVALTATISSSFGGPISLAGFIYKLDLSLLPVLPEFYRIASENMSLMDFIDEICKAANHDYFFRLETVGAFNILKLFTINRNEPVLFGKIDEFIANIEGQVNSESGFEIRNEPTSKFLLGGSLSDIFYQSATFGSDDEGDNQEEAALTEPWDNSIWPFWGFDALGNVILGEGINDTHTMVLDSRWVTVAGVGDTYASDVGELRAAKESQESWESYLWIHNNNKFRFDVEGEETDEFRDPLTNNPLTENGQTRKYTHNNKLNPHYGKASVLRIPGTAHSNFMFILYGLSNQEIVGRDVLSIFGPFSVEQIKSASLSNDPIEDTTENLAKLYSYIKDFSEEYYGKKWMVRLPFLLADRESETRELVLSSEPEQTGYVGEENFENAINNNLLPYDILKFAEPNGRVTAFVRFDNADDRDFTEISEQDIAFNSVTIRNNIFASAFIKCQVEPNVIFRDKDTLFSPRAIITLPGAVRLKKSLIGGEGREFFGVIAEGLRIVFQDPARPNQPATTEEINALLDVIFKRFGSDTFKLGKAGQAVIPDVAAVPMRSNIDKYGPWYAASLVNGPLQFEQDENLVPWNFGSFQDMNLAGNSKVQEAISNVQIYEAGSIEFPGVPGLNVGAQLLAAGPYVTSIDVRVENDVTTRYSLSVWTPHPYKLRKIQTEYMLRLGRRAQEIRYNLAHLLRQAPKKPVFVSKAKNNPPANRDKSSTSNYIIAAEGFNIGDGSKIACNVVMQPAYNFATQIDSSEYKQKAAVSLDGIFRPFSTNKTIGSGMAHFQEPENVTDADIDVDKLNPFSDSQSSIPDIGLALRGDEYEDPVFVRNTENLDDIRAIGLRAPLILIGWGYDTNDNPVPNNAGDGGSSPSFVSNYKQRQDLWKAGPLDARWDNDRKVWVAGGVEVKEGIFNGSLGQGNFEVPSTCPFDVYKPIGLGGNMVKQGNLTVYNRDQTLVVPSGTYGIVIKIGNEYRVIWTAC